jgi:hypothetical protein
MTLGVGVAYRDYAGTQQSAHDRGLASALSSFYDASPSLEINRGDVLTEIQRTQDYIRTQDGMPWPPLAEDYTLSPTVTSRPGNINKGWNAAAQPGSPPGLDGCGCRDANFGGLTYEQAMNYSPAPLTDNLGSLQRLDQIYQEPSYELRPGFGRIDTDDILSMLIIAAGGYGGYALSRNRATGTRVAVTAGGLLAGYAAAALISLSGAFGP